MVNKKHGTSDKLVAILTEEMEDRVKEVERGSDRECSVHSHGDIGF